MSRLPSAHPAMRASCGRRALLCRWAASRVRPAAIHWCTAAGVGGGQAELGMCSASECRESRHVVAMRLPPPRPSPSSASSTSAVASADGSGATVCCWPPAWSTACGDSGMGGNLSARHWHGSRAALRRQRQRRRRRAAAAPPTALRTLKWRPTGSTSPLEAMAGRLRGCGWASWLAGAFRGPQSMALGLQHRQDQQHRGLHRHWPSGRHETTAPTWASWAPQLGAG